MEEDPLSPIKITNPKKACISTTVIGFHRRPQFEPGAWPVLRWSLDTVRCWPVYKLVWCTRAFTVTSSYYKPKKYSTPRLYQVWRSMGQGWGPVNVAQSLISEDWIWPHLLSTNRRLISSTTTLRLWCKCANSSYNSKSKDSPSKKRSMSFSRSKNSQLSSSKELLAKILVVCHPRFILRVAYPYFIPT